MLHILETSLLLLVLLLAITAEAQQAEAVPPVAPIFKNIHAIMALGQDNLVYLAAGDHILYCERDGSKPVVGAAGSSLTGATANAQGIIAAAHAHFAKDVTLYDPNFGIAGRFTRIEGYNFTAPAAVDCGPSGDFYVLDQGKDQVTRFHPDGIRAAVYQIPHEEYPDKRFGYLTRLCVNEETKSLYVLNWQNLRCFSTDSAEFQYTPVLKWELKQPGICTELSYGYGGFDVDASGKLYIIPPVRQDYLSCYDIDGKPLPNIPLKVGEYKLEDPTRVLGLCVSKNEVFIKRQHETELFLRFNLETGELIAAVPTPVDYTAIQKVPATALSDLKLAAVNSNLGIPTDRKKVIRVLFIGNSQINCIFDIPDMVEAISRSTNNKELPLIVTDEVVVGGTGLEGYWKNGLGQKRIADGGWDYVVINDIVYSFGMTNTAKFTEYAGKFLAETTKIGAKLVLFATADVEKKRDQHQLMYQDAVSFARANNCLVAGGGMAWLKAWEKDATLDFHYTDRAHPNGLGCYLNSLVIYAALTGSNPAEQTLTNCNVATNEQAILLQQVAGAQAIEDRKMEKAE